MNIKNSKAKSMCQLFESIRIEAGIIHHLELHQERVNRSLLKLGVSTKVDLSDFTHSLSLPEKGIFKLRIAYDKNGIIDQQLIPYIIRSVKSVELVIDNSIDYSLKFEDRSPLTRLQEGSDADEIIIVKDNMITDSSISNILLYDGSFWYTPSKPLLEGTQRAHLIKRGIIKTAPIKIEALNNFSHFCFINALNPFESALKHPIDLVLNN